MNLRLLESLFRKNRNTLDIDMQIPPLAEVFRGYGFGVQSYLLRRCLDVQGYDKASFCETTTGVLDRQDATLKQRRYSTQ